MSGHAQPTSGAVLKKLCERAYHRYNQLEYERLSQISVAHLYNLTEPDTYAAPRPTSAAVAY